MRLNQIIATALIGATALMIPGTADALSTKGQAYLDHLRSKRQVVQIEKSSSRSVVRPMHSNVSSLSDFDSGLLYRDSKTLREIKSKNNKVKAETKAKSYIKSRTKIKPRSRSKVDVLNRRKIYSGKVRFEYGQNLEDRLKPGFSPYVPESVALGLSRVDYDVRNSFNKMMTDRGSYADVIGFMKDKTEKQKLLAVRSMAGLAGSMMYDHTQNTDRVEKSEFFNRLQNAYNDEKTKYGVCRHIHGVISEMARDMGLGAFSSSVNSSAGGHVVSTVYTKDLGWLVVDYSTIHVTGARTLSKALNYYQLQHDEITFDHNVFDGTHKGKVYSEGYEQMNEFLGIHKKGICADTKDVLLRRNVVDRTRLVVKNSPNERSVTYKAKQKSAVGDGGSEGGLVVKYGEIDWKDWKGTTAKVAALGYGHDGVDSKSFGGLIRMTNEDVDYNILRFYGVYGSKDSGSSGSRVVLGGDIFKEVSRSGKKSQHPKSVVDDFLLTTGFSKYKQSKNSRSDFYVMAHLDIGSPEDYNYDDDGVIFGKPTIVNKVIGFNQSFAFGKTRLDLNPEYEVTPTHKMKNFEIYTMGPGVRLRAKYGLGSPRDSMFSERKKIEASGEFSIGRNLDFEIQYEKTEDDYHGIKIVDEKKFGVVKVRF
ncbi:MAG: hypothetical protein U9R08_01395 [Nanoarchaeota archaeon]|nr:hypothetical protein [Nanoarchaeota archaeon]